MKTRIPWLAALVCSTSLVLALPTPAGAQLTVYDPTNYASNVMQAARALEQINNQVRGLQNQALSLTNQARNLAQLPYSSLQTVQGNLGRISSRAGPELAANGLRQPAAVGRTFRRPRLAGRPRLGDPVGG